MRKKLADRRKRAIANLAGVEGAREPSRNQIHAKMGAMVITKNGSTD
jgi:hypothetical protein